MPDNTLETAKKNFNNRESLIAVADSAFALLSYFLPQLGIIAPQIQESFSEKICKNRQLFCDSIMALGFSVTPDQVHDVAFLTEFKNTIEVIDRLATNEKIKFFASLFYNSFSGKDKLDYKDYDEYDELLRTLAQLSKSETCLLIDFWRASRLQKLDKNNPAFQTSWDRFAAICFDKGIDKERLVAKMTAISRTGLCKEETSSIFGNNGGMFFPTPLLNDLIAKIQNEKEQFC